MAIEVRWEKPPARTCKASELKYGEVGRGVLCPSDIYLGVGYGKPLVLGSSGGTLGVAFSPEREVHVLPNATIEITVKGVQ